MKDLNRQHVMVKAFNPPSTMPKAEKTQTKNGQNVTSTLAQGRARDCEQSRRLASELVHLRHI